MQIVIKNKTYVNAPEFLSEILADRLTFENPKYIENAKHDRWQGDTPRFLRSYEFDGQGLIIPRGFTRQLIQLCRRHGVRFQVEDCRRVLPDVSFFFAGSLRPFQQEAVEAILKRDFGTLSAPTGAGKTVIALKVIAERRQPALVIVHTKELLYQWVDRIERFLEIPREQIGVIGDGRRDIGEEITVGLVQSVYKVADEVAQYFGHLIVDECHRAPSRTFTEAVTAFDCKYMLGLSATPWRRDKLSRLIYWYMGDMVQEIKADVLQDTGDILRADVIVRETQFRPFSDPTDEYSRMLSELTEDPRRNELIAADVVNEARNGSGICLVLSDRKAHCERLQSLIQGHGVKADLLTGDLGNGARQEVVEALNAGRVKVLVATGQLIGEGFDCPELSTLFLATPIKFKAGCSNTWAVCSDLRRGRIKPLSMITLTSMWAF